MARLNLSKLDSTLKKRSDAEGPHSYRAEVASNHSDLLQTPGFFQQENAFIATA